MDSIENSNTDIQPKNVSVLEKLRALKERRGFTLVELIIVIAIIAVMSAIIIPNVANQAKATQDSLSAVAMSLFYYGQDALSNAKAMTVGRELDREFGKWNDMYVWQLKRNKESGSPPYENYRVNNDYRPLGKLNAVYFSAEREGATLKLTAISFIFGDAELSADVKNGFKATGTEGNKGWVYDGEVDADTGAVTFLIEAADKTPGQKHTKDVLERISNNLNSTFSILDDEDEGHFILLFDNQMRAVASYHSKYPFIDSGTEYSWTKGIKSDDSHIWVTHGTLLGTKSGFGNEEVGAVFNNHALGNIIMGAYPRWLGEDGAVFADRSKLGIADGI